MNPSHPAFDDYDVGRIIRRKIWSRPKSFLKKHVPLRTFSILLSTLSLVYLIALPHVPPLIPVAYVGLFYLVASINNSEIAIDMSKYVSRVSLFYRVNIIFFFLAWQINSHFRMTCFLCAHMRIVIVKQGIPNATFLFCWLGADLFVSYLHIITFDKMNKELETDEARRAATERNNDQDLPNTPRNSDQDLPNMQRRLGNSTSSSNTHRLSTHRSGGPMEVAKERRHGPERNRAFHPKALLCRTTTTTERTANVSELTSSV